MADEDDLGFTPDEIGEWSERKIDIVTAYAKPFFQIINKNGLVPIYVDGLAGGGSAIRKQAKPVDGAVPLPLTVDGAPLGTPTEVVLTTAAQIVEKAELRFAKYIFVDADKRKTDAMRQRCAGLPDKSVDVMCADASEAIINVISPKIRENWRNRALCFLDPYGMHISWEAFRALGQTGQCEVFINFPTLDIVRNILRPDPAAIGQSHSERMDRLWGDDSWKSVAFSRSQGLFEELATPESGEKMAAAFRQRLIDKGGFQFVTPPLPFTNNWNGLLYHLLFATQKERAFKIANDVMKKRANPKKRGLYG